mmetsp:Transcript_93757/g.248918  ORF Transcript_93757/g.248918 Transcript_93757/m.248918 type:complete len:119 (+) Transcript_93757:667-1023(+)
MALLTVELKTTDDCTVLYVVECMRLLSGALAEPVAKGVGVAMVFTELDTVTPGSCVKPASFTGGSCTVGALALAVTVVVEVGGDSWPTVDWRSGASIGSADEGLLEIAAALAPGRDGA